jgi:hypothetical protein
VVRRYARRGVQREPAFPEVKEKGEVPPWYESALYQLYNATDHPENFLNCPTIAYAGEKDGRSRPAT